ncbi:MAG TPA: hypothetical protein VMZ11_03805 [Mycobacteriales bacterium]|nr:hypothetical protein [Mycobacteriales bacterium]
MTLAERLLRDGVPPSLLIDLLDPDGMRAALASELLPSDVARVEATPQERLRSVS